MRRRPPCRLRGVSLRQRQLLLREDGGGALGDLAHPGQQVEPGEGELPERCLGEAPRVEEQRELAAVDHVVEGAPGRVAAVDVQHVGEAVAATA